MQDTLHWVIWGLGILVTGLGGFLAGYLKKKGENLAQKENLENLIKEVHAVTTTTKKIEAEISSGVWDRQKRWELKRDVLFEAARRIAATYDALKNLDNYLQTEIKNPAIKNLGWTQIGIDENTKWFKAKAALDESRLFIEVTCGGDVADAVDKFGHLTTTVAAKINKNDSEIFKQSTAQLFSLNNTIKAAIRKELAIETAAENSGS
jgi:hypothetical protein